MRYLIQSAVSHEFLHWSPRTGSVAWTPSLATALVYGVASDLEQVAQLVDDHADGCPVITVDIDNPPEGL